MYQKALNNFSQIEKKIQFSKENILNTLNSCKQIFEYNNNKDNF